MFIEQITKIFAQLISKLVVARSATARTRPPRDGLILGESSLDDDIDQETRTQPYVPTKDERLSESSLHLSC